MAYTAYDDDEQRKPIANQKNYYNTDEYNDTDLEETDETTPTICSATKRRNTMVRR